MRSMYASSVNVKHCLLYNSFKLPEGVLRALFASEASQEESGNARSVVTGTGCLGSSRGQHTGTTFLEKKITLQRRNIRSFVRKKEIFKSINRGN